MLTVICAIAITGSQAVHPALAELSERYLVDKLPAAKLQVLIEQYEKRTGMARLDLHGVEIVVPYIPNLYKRGDPIPYMPGAGKPRLDDDEPVRVYSLLIKNP
ncbi:MAG: hypothetical protein IH944_04795 [Armatimonadetes bacterium]|nr:hypothetical protein [Armatimonadota bacterium]